MLQSVARLVLSRYKSTRAWKPLSAEQYKQLLAKSDETHDKNLPQWQKRDIAHKHRYGEWKPTKKLSRQQMADIRSLKEDHPLLKTAQLANYFNVSPEAVRRILRSKWIPNDSEEDRIAARAARRKIDVVELRQKQVERLEDEIRKLHHNKSVTVDSIRVALPSSPNKPRKRSHRNSGSDARGQQQQRGRQPQVSQDIEDLLD